MVRRPRGMRWPWLAMCVVSGSVLMTSSLVVANVSVADVTLVGGRQRTESDGVLLEDNIGEGTELPDHDTSDDDGSDETGNNESVDDTPAAIDFPSFAEWRDRKAEEKAVVDAAMVVNATDEPAAAGEDHRLTDGTKPSTESASTGITGDNSRVHMHADERQTTTPHTSGHSQQLSGAADRQHVPVITDAQAKATNDKNTNIDHAASDSVNNATSSSGTLAFTSAIHRERFNFASVFMGWLSTFLFDCGAVVRSTGRGASSATAILKENKDAYMLQTCDAPEKFVVIELCEEILVDTVVLANYEFFSSMFEVVRVSVSNRYPPKKEWTVVGEVHAENTRQSQTFKITNPAIWARYVRIDFVSHYGNEYYCPVSSVKILGSTMMEDLLQDQEAAAVGSQGTTGQQKAEDDKRQDVIAVDIAPTKTVEPSLPHVEPTAIVVPMSSIVVPALPVETRRPKPFSADIVTPSPALVTVLPQTPVPVSPSSSVSVPSVVAPSSPSTRASHTSPAPTATTSQQKQSPPPPPPKADTYIAPPLNTQDSVFKTILKRLTRLEENLTLSIGYIEDQGSRVRELFIAMEAQQREKLEGFIEDVDERLREDFEGVRLRYASLWDDILLELRIFQETVAHNMHTLHGAVDRMTYEVSLLQRWAVVQLFLMFALVVFGANLNGYARGHCEALARRYGIELDRWRDYLAQLPWPFSLWFKSDVVASVPVASTVSPIVEKDMPVSAEPPRTPPSRHPSETALDATPRPSITGISIAAPLSPSRPPLMPQPTIRTQSHSPQRRPPQPTAVFTPLDTSFAHSNVPQPIMTAPLPTLSNPDNTSVRQAAAPNDFIVVKHRKKTHGPRRASLPNLRLS